MVDMLLPLKIFKEKYGLQQQKVVGTAQSGPVNHRLIQSLCQVGGSDSLLSLFICRLVSLNPPLAALYVLL